MATIVPGMFGTGDWATDQRPTNFREKILRLFPDSPAVMTALMGKMKSESVDDPKFTWFEEGLPTYSAVAYANAAIDATAIYITGQDTYKAFRAGMALMNEASFEVMWVTAAAAEDANQSKLTVVRAKGSTAVAITAGERLTICGTHNEEGVDTPAAIAFNPSTVTNYTQIFRRSLNITRTAMKTKLRTGDDYKNKKRSVAEQHAIDMEWAFNWGSAVETTGANSRYDRTTKGLCRFITSNIKDFVGAVDADQIDDFFEQLARQGSSTRLCLAGSGLINVLQKAVAAKATYTIKAGESIYGMKVMEWITPQLRVLFKQHPLWSQSETFRYAGVILDTKNIMYRPLKDSDTKYLKNRQNPGADGVIDEYLTEAGLEVQHESTHGLMLDASGLS